MYTHVVISFSLKKTKSNQTAQVREPNYDLLTSKVVLENKILNFEIDFKISNLQLQKQTSFYISIKSTKCLQNTFQ